MLGLALGFLSKCPAVALRTCISSRFSTDASVIGLSTEFEDPCLSVWHAEEVSLKVRLKGREGSNQEKGWGS